MPRLRQRECVPIAREVSLELPFYYALIVVFSIMESECAEVRAQEIHRLDYPLPAERRPFGVECVLVL